MQFFAATLFQLGGENIFMNIYGSYKTAHCRQYLAIERNTL